nr:hematopoietic lineage cell-specific protein-like isoform X2 [Paramormyrops kingsleyae]
MWKSGVSDDMKGTAAGGGDRWERRADFASRPSPERGAVEQARCKDKTIDGSSLLGLQKLKNNRKMAELTKKIFARNRKQQLKPTVGPGRRVSVEKMSGQVNKFSMGLVYKFMKNLGDVHQDGGKSGGDKKATSQAAADFERGGGGPERPHHTHAASSHDMECTSAPCRQSITSAGRVATLKAQFEDIMQGMSEDSRRRLENNSGMRETQQHQCGGKQMGQGCTPAPKSRKTAGVLKMLRGTGGPSAQVQEMIRNAGQVETEAAGKAQHTDPEPDGVYETMEKAPPQVDESEYVEAMAVWSAVAMYSYQAETEDQLSFKANDIIVNIERVSATWWRGRCRERVGLFPACFVQPIW